jgi:hypothetical protein
MEDNPNEFRKISCTRFDERPDTGISFDDIAGIDEAANSEEIVFILKNQR